VDNPAWWGGVAHPPPELDLPPSLDGYELGAIAYLLAVMVSPDDAELRERFILFHHCEALRLSLQWLPSALPVSMSAKEMLLLRDGPRYSDIYPSLQAAAVGGGVCGQMLLFIRDEHLAGKKASLQRAYDMAAAALSQQRKGSKPSLIKLWQRYSCVAHLYAAVLLIRDNCSDGPAYPCSTATLPTFLAVAEDLRRWGANFTPVKGQLPILSPSSTWRVPPGLRLPKIKISLPI
jgi:hypothetical protein